MSRFSGFVTKSEDYNVSDFGSYESYSSGPLFVDKKQIADINGKKINCQIVLYGPMAGVTIVRISCNGEHNFENYLTKYNINQIRSINNSDMDYARYTIYKYKKIHLCLMEHSIGNFGISYDLFLIHDSESVEIIEDYCRTELFGYWI